MKTLILILFLAPISIIQEPTEDGWPSHYYVARTYLTLIAEGKFEEATYLMQFGHNYLNKENFMEVASWIYTLSNTSGVRGYETSA